MKALVFAASLRKGSFNRKLAAQAAEILRSQPSWEVDHADFREFEMPVYDGDLEEQIDSPPGAVKLGKRIQEADAIVISTPEYNGGIPGPLKNAIDWISRLEPNPLEEKKLLLIGTSPGALGAVRGLWHTRVPFEAMGTFVYPLMFGLPKADQAFDESGNFLDAKFKGRLQELIGEFLKFVEKK